MESKDLTKKHRFLVNSYQDGEWDTVAKFGKHCYQKDFDGTAYLSGPVVDRLHEFEKLGYEPEELKKILETHGRWKRILNSVHGKFNYQDTDSLKRMEIEMRLFENCKDMHIDYSKPLGPCTLTRAEIEELGKMDIPSLYPQIMAAIPHRPRNNKVVYISTSGCDKDSPIVKKLKESMYEDKLISNATKKYIEFDTNITKQYHEWQKRNPSLTKSFNVSKKSGDRPWGWGVPGINRVIFNNPATIVFWDDGDKTVVKCQNGEPYDPENGLAMAISKKALGGGNKWYDEVKKHLKAYEDVQKVCAKLQEEACVVNNGKKHIKSEEECANCHWYTRNSGCKNNTCKGCNHYGDDICKCCSVNNGEECPYFKEEKK